VQTAYSYWRVIEHRSIIYAQKKHVVKVASMKLYQLQTDKQKKHVQELFLEFYTWALDRNKEEYGLVFDADGPQALVKRYMASLDEFLPPSGSLLLAYIDEQPAGVACMRTLDNGIYEIKRMYVKPKYRGKGIGRALLQEQINRARQYNGSIIRLDSSRFMTAAHSLYRSVGFKDIEPYKGSEIPAEIQKYWIFMELKLNSTMP
jgi:GNAT superfamily N-acetyltransferase